MTKKTTNFGKEVIAEDEKRGRVAEVFDSVASKYDLMNDLMSAGAHRLWKRMVAADTGLKPGQSALDVAGGTADIALLMADKVGKSGRVVVYDINGEMLKYGREKVIDKGHLSDMQFIQGNAEDISFADNTFEVATVGFGIRNVTHLAKALGEMTRVVKPGGRVICLEFSHPRSALFRAIYDAYSINVLPNVGSAITGDRAAYVYLHESIRKFPTQEELKATMESVGLYRVRYYNILNGIAAVHIGYKV
ncbi:MAG: bifunctional demethylmenaquinone methyltransferase/2-methoxy-6-polyprenyl-1,4-benzoquinol methylase UbiE [Proteobacteria bacterium]|nr:bifunctional demethylmenaquinone methyltransferase/2-methoxy-6-polyprenyl-1,4-benzoquinol methylase UbiE [Pseudomonadota bacterium]